LHNKQVDILVGPRTIEAWYGNERYTTHNRCANAGKVILTEHLPLATAWYAGRNPTELVRSLGLCGPHVASWAHAVFAGAAHEDAAWRVLDGMSRLAKRYPDRIDRVCRIALAHEDRTLKGLKQIITSEEDVALATSEELTPELHLHENIRGAVYYHQGVLA
jgi:hypothetical protein